MNRFVLAVLVFFAFGLRLVGAGGGPTFVCHETGLVFAPAASDSGNFSCCCGENITRLVFSEPTADQKAGATTFSPRSCCDLRNTEAAGSPAFVPAPCSHAFAAFARFHPRRCVPALLRDFIS